MITALLTHWPEYLSEALLLATFMLSACVAVFVLEHPASPLSRHLQPAWRRRVVIGVLMGLTAIALIDSPLGRRSGAHMNPATTLTFLVLGKIDHWNAVFYILAQFAGGLAGVAAASAAMGRGVRHRSVNYAATQPGPRGVRAAWLAEFIIAFGMMAMVLLSTNYAGTAPYTGVFAGVLIALYIAVEAPFSGMSMNPARTLGSAVHARAFNGLWVYFTAPPLAMLAAAGLYTAVAGTGHVYCAKLNHKSRAPCIFNCRIEDMAGLNRGERRTHPTPH